MGSYAPIARLRLAPELIENLTHGELILNAGDDLHWTATVITDRILNSENSLQSLRPRHRHASRDLVRVDAACGALPCLFLTATLTRRDLVEQ
jgi:hypothetical protein